MIYHVYSAYEPKDPDIRRRMNLAKRTWAKQPWEEIPIQDDQVRCYRDHKGTVPFLRDIINAATKGKDKTDILVFTNSDICVSTDCSYKIVMGLHSTDAIYCFRRDFSSLDTIIPDAAIKKGHHYCGSDLYGFRIGWWQHYHADFPDLLLGREGWDAVLRILIEQSHPGRNVTLHNLIYHEKHGSVWENPQNRRTIPSQLHNISLVRNFCYQYGFDPRKIGL